MIINLNIKFDTSKCWWQYAIDFETYLKSELDVCKMGTTDQSNINWVFHLRPGLVGSLTRPTLRSRDTCSRVWSSSNTASCRSWRCSPKISHGNPFSDEPRFNG